MSPSELRELILREIDRDPDAELLLDSPDEVRIFDVEYGREISFFVRPRTRDELRGVVHAGPAVERASEAVDAVAGVLARLDPTTLLNLRHVLILADASDARALCDELSLDEELLPDALLDETDGGEERLSPDCVGVHWFYESAAVVNADAIRRDVAELCADGILDPEYETRAGFWTTLLHEIRHDQVDGCPYELPWLRDEDAAEDAVERWARDEFERLRL